jgi:DNA-binding Xre family transcriptional regulator
LVRQRRQVSYDWRLREVMAEHKLYATTELVPLLAERGIVLSTSQVHRLVTTTPERLSLQILAALCDIFGVDAAELIPIAATNVGVKKVAEATAVVGSARPRSPRSLRPVRARVVTPKE